MQKGCSDPLLPLREGELCWEIFKKALLSGAAVSSTGIISRLNTWLLMESGGMGQKRKRGGERAKGFSSESMIELDQDLLLHA